MKKAIYLSVISLSGVLLVVFLMTTEIADDAMSTDNASEITMISPPEIQIISSSSDTDSTSGIRK